MATSFQITLALIGVVVVLGVCIPVWLKKLKLDNKELDYHHPHENSIKNFKLNVNLQTDDESKNLDQLNLPIQEEDDNQLSLFEENDSNDAVGQDIGQEIRPKEIVYKLFIRPKFDIVFSGSKIRQILESKGMHVDRLPVFCKKILIKEQSIVVNVADMYEPGIIELDTIDSSYFKGLVIFMTMGTPRNQELLSTFFELSCEISALLQGELFLDEHVFTEQEFSAYELILLED